MSRQSVSAGGRADAAEYKHELLGRLGLRADASDQEVEAARNGLVDFLELAPHEVKSWATARTADVDEAFALLSGPERDLVPPTHVAEMAQDGPVAAPPPPPPAAARPAPAVAPAAGKPRRTQIIAAVAAVAVVGIVFAVFQMGKTADVPGISGAPTGQETTAAPSGGPSAVPVDKTKVAALMTKISANPKDTASLLALGDIYFAAADYKNAAAWEQRVLSIDPKNQVALLAAGAAQFNLGNAPAAKKQWLVAAALYPKSAEVHYDLGFLYLSQTPPDKAGMTAEWQKVIAIDPNSELAKTVSNHIKSSNPTASATPSAK